jgi:hypothetical protein
MYTMQLCTDLLLDKMNQAIHFRLPGQGDPSQLPYLANDRLLVQGPAETNATFVTRLQKAFKTWKKAGSRVAVIEQIQAYMQNLQPGVAATLPEMTIVGGCYPNVATWDTQYIGDALGQVPTKTTITPSNFNWDGKSQPWRAWLVLFMSLVPTGQSGTNAATSTASGGSYVSPGQNVSGVWVPATSGSTVNAPFLTVTGLSGMTSANVGQWLTLSLSAHGGNNGTFPITAFNSATSVVIANPAGVINDIGPVTWSVGSYPFIGPGPAWGAPGYVFGQGQATPPPLDTGRNVQGVWQPTLANSGYGTSLSWGLTCSAQTIESIRLLLKRWKSAATYYPDIIVAFDGVDGELGSAYSPNSTPGLGNPDGTFGGRGKRVNGVWVPNRLIRSPFTAYCQGTGSWQYCSVPNVN